MAAAGQVVVGVSGSLAGLAALRTAARAARDSGRVLVAVHAWEPPEGEVLYVRNPDGAWPARCAREAAARLDRAFEEAFGRYAARGHRRPPGWSVPVPTGRCADWPRTRTTSWSSAPARGLVGPRSAAGCRRTPAARS
ncbi:universal stress protein [Streptomyces mirabilis]